MSEGNPHMPHVASAKLCRGCNRELPLEAFGRNTRAPDGLQWHCKDCRRRKANVWRKANPDRVRGHKQKEYLKNRKKYLARSKKQREEKPGDVARYLRDWRQRQLEKSPEEYKEAMRVRVRNRRARIRQAEGSHTVEEFLELCQKYGGYCLCCRRKPDLLTADHIVPLSKGGSNDIENIQPLCGSCNKKKHAKTVDYRQAERSEKGLKECALAQEQRL